MIVLLTLGEGSQLVNAVTEETTSSTAANEDVLPAQGTVDSSEKTVTSSSEVAEEETTSSSEEATTESTTETSEETEKKKEKSKTTRAASDPVNIPDPALNRWIRDTLNAEPLKLGIADTDSVTEEHMEKLTELKRAQHSFDYSSISDLTGLEYAINLETLDFQNGKKGNTNDTFTAVPAFFEDLKKLKYLRFNYGVVSDINALKNHPNLQVFSAEQNELTSLEGLSGCKELLTVNVEGTGRNSGYKNCGIQDFSGLEQATKLKELYFYKDTDDNGPTRVSASSVEPSYVGHGLQSLKGLNCKGTLETLELGGHPGLATLDGLQGYTALKTLKIRGGDSYNGRATEYTNPGGTNNLIFDPSLHTSTYLPRGLRGKNALAALSDCTSLTTVSLSNNAIEDLSPLSNKTSLRTMNISRNLVTTLSPLATTNKLVTLDASNNLLTNLSGLENTDTLQVLGVGSQCAGAVKMKDSWGIAYSNLKGLLTDISAVNPKSLTTFVTEHNNLDDLAQLKGAANLIEIKADNNNFTDINGDLDGCVSLQRVSLNKNKFENFKDVGLHDAKGTLKSIGLSEQKVLKSLEGLKDYTALESMYFNSNVLTDSEMAEIPNSVVELSVSYNDLQRKAFETFDPTKMTKLSSLIAQHNHISDITPLEAFSGLYNLDLASQRLLIPDHGGTASKLSSPDIGFEVDALKSNSSSGLTYSKRDSWGSAKLSLKPGSSNFIVEDPNYYFHNQKVSAEFKYTNNPVATYFSFSGTISFDADYDISTTAEITLIPTDINGTEISEITPGGVIYWRAKAKGKDEKYLKNPEFKYNLYDFHDFLDPYTDPLDSQASEYVNGARVEMGGSHIPTPGGIWKVVDVLNDKINKDHEADITIVTKVTDNAPVGKDVSLYLCYEGLNFVRAEDKKTIKIKAKVPEVIKLSAPDRFDFGKGNEATKKAKIYKPDAKSYTTQEQTDGFNVRVTDTRQTSNRTDWKVVGQLSDLTNSKSTALKAGSVAPTLTLKDIDLYKMDIDAGTEAKVAHGSTGNPTWDRDILLTAGGSSVNVSNAASADGEGVWDYRIPFDKVELNVPSNVNDQAGYTFKGKLTWTLDDTL